MDDERLAVQRLTRLLVKRDASTIAAAATDPEEALAPLRERDVDVVFLDIQMPGLTGFELIERLDRDVPVVFTTAYDRYALEAFAVNSIDYLLKPVETERSARRSTSSSGTPAGRPVRMFARSRGSSPRAGAGPEARADRVARRRADDGPRRRRGSRTSSRRTS